MQISADKLDNKYIEDAFDLAAANHKILAGKRNAMAEFALLRRMLAYQIKEDCIIVRDGVTKDEILRALALIIVVRCHESVADYDLLSELFENTALFEEGDGEKTNMLKIDSKYF